MPAQPRKTVIGNWKANGRLADLDEVRALVAELTQTPARARVGLCPPATLLHAAADLARESVMLVGAQDVSAADCGAHTGDLAAAMLVDAGARMVIVGHSERRTDHGETDAVVAAKACAASAAGLEPIVCVGETLEQHDRGVAKAVVRRQLEGSLPRDLVGKRFCLAYEPIWAIGSGRTATPEQVGEMHAMIGEAVVRFGDGVAVLYGGSVTGENAAELLAVEGVDGALVGGASLTCAKFLPIVRAAAALAQAPGG